MLDAIGNLSQLVGALAVIASLAYLAVQVRQNTKLARATAQHSVMMQLAEFTLRIAEGDLTDLLLRGLREGDQLTEIERTRFNSIMTTYFLVAASQYALHRQGIVRKSDWEPTRSGLARYLARPGGAAWWNFQGRNLVHPVFAEMIEQTILKRDRARSQDSISPER